MTITTERRAAPEPRVSHPVQPAGRSRRVDPIYVFMLAPVVVLFTLFITFPALLGMFYSVTNYVGYGDWKFIGLTNYRAIFSDPGILHAYSFTLGFSLVTVIVVNIAALALAIGLNSKIKWKTGLRGAFFIPMVISGIVIAYVFNYLFSTSLPTIATSIGFGPLENSILANENVAWIAIVLVTAWQSVPSAMIIYLAGLLAIPGEVYEAASIDGASAWRQFRSITYPLVVGYVVINMILGFKSFLNAYDIIVGLTTGAQALPPAASR